MFSHISTSDGSVCYITLYVTGEADLSRALLSNIRCLFTSLTKAVLFSSKHHDKVVIYYLEYDKSFSQMSKSISSRNRHQMESRVIAFKLLIYRKVIEPADRGPQELLKPRFSVSNTRPSR